MVAKHNNENPLKQKCVQIGKQNVSSDLFWVVDKEFYFIQVWH